MFFGNLSSTIALRTMFKKSHRKQIIGAIGTAILSNLFTSTALAHTVSVMGC